MEKRRENVETSSGMEWPSVRSLEKQPLIRYNRPQCQREHTNHTSVIVQGHTGFVLVLPQRQDALLLSDAEPREEHDSPSR